MQRRSCSDDLIWRRRRVHSYHSHTNIITQQDQLRIEKISNRVHLEPPNLVSHSV